MIKTEPILKANGIEKYFNDPVRVKVLDNISFEIQKGDFVAITGKSGCGKSTLLYILSTLDTDYDGQLWLEGKLTSGKSDKELALIRNQKIGFVFQFHNLLPEFSAMENIMIPGLIAKMEEKKVKARSLKLLESLGLKDRAIHKPSELSGGEQQRVAVARALINEPALIFADEPSGNLDSNNAKELHQLFFKLRDDFGQTFVIVTHNQEFAAMTDRKLEIKDGRMVN